MYHAFFFEKNQDFLGRIHLNRFMYNRAEVIDRNFRNYVSQEKFPKKHSHTPEDTGLKPFEFIELFESQIISRQLDLMARTLKNKGECFYTIGSSGHEGNAACGKVFGPKDMAFLHYRSGAFMVQRARHQLGSTPIHDTLLSLVASREDPISGGRHKVWGSLSLNVPPQTSTIASHLPKTLGAAFSVCRAKDLGIKGVMDEDSVVIGSFGDASVNHSTALGAINTARWMAYQGLPIPLVFICEDNEIGVSVPTPRNWIEHSFSNLPELVYLKADGLNLLDVYAKSLKAQYHARLCKKPVFLHIKMVRLLGHAGSDVEMAYRSLSEIEATEFEDPLLHSARQIRESNWLSAKDIVDIYDSLADQLARVSQYVVTRPRLKKASEVRQSLWACKFPRKAPVQSKEFRQNLFGMERLNEPAHMAKLINWGLTDILLRYKNAVLFGQDVAKKGGVYRVTDQLQKRFGSKRVFDSLLDEQSILGTAIGLSHNGLLPLPEIQFLAYLHNAEDQIRGEAATLAFFSQGQFTNPMVVRIAGLAYQKGFGGHFHNDNSLAVLRDIPGLVVAVPSRGDDAVKMLRSCVRWAYEKGRVVVFVEPIALYMVKDLYEKGDKKWSFIYPDIHEEVPVGKLGVYNNERKSDLCILTYGNGVYHSLQAKKVLEEIYEVGVKLLDLRWLAPIDYKELVAEMEGFKSLLIVDECRQTGSLGEALVGHLYNRMSCRPQIKVLAADDCWIPLGEAASVGLPKKQDILKASLELLDQIPNS